MTTPRPIIDDLLNRVGEIETAGKLDDILRELGWALISEGQIFLHANSDEHDVELFFETYGYPRSEPPSAWVDRILVGLRQRVGEEQANAVELRALERAAKKIRGDAGQASPQT